MEVMDAKNDGGLEPKATQEALILLSPLSLSLSCPLLLFSEQVDWKQDVKGLKGQKGNKNILLFELFVSNTTKRSKEGQK
jgi:hypothetical protein